MCGIVGYCGDRSDIPSILIEGLKRLEYRGYDSSGMALVNDEKIVIEKEVGKIVNLERKIDVGSTSFSAGIGHTRWATHGNPSVLNAHPHVDCKNNIALVHNGIIENFIKLRDKLTQNGHRFNSETDSEVLVHLIEDYYNINHDPEKSLVEALLTVKGTFGLAVLFKDYPDKIFIARRGSPLVVGINENEKFIASDVSALLRYTDKVVFLNDNEVGIIEKNNFILKNLNQEILKFKIEKIDWGIEDIDKAGYPHYMLKEIYEQKDTIVNAMRGRIDYENATAHFGGLNLTPNQFHKVKRISILACGTSWHAGLVGKYIIEALARIPVTVEYASEYRYKNSILESNTLAIAISQSGETADTLGALREAKRKGATVLGITNVVGSTIARETDGGIYLHSGPEIGVASTKAFTSQLVVLSLLALFLGRQRNLSYQEGKNIIAELEQLSSKVETILAQSSVVESFAPYFKEQHNALYLGRGFNYPVALEGALKLKEISYVHGEGYPAAEMKHGPIALIDDAMPVVFLALKDSIYDKILSNIQEVRARGGKIFAVATEGDTEIQKHVDFVTYIPETLEFLTPILSVIPLQFLSYYVALLRGCDVDQPKNLAKSVTVE